MLIFVFLELLKSYITRYGASNDQHVLCVVYVHPTFYFKKRDRLDVLWWIFVGKICWLFNRWILNLRSWSPSPTLILFPFFFLSHKVIPSTIASSFSICWVPQPPSSSSLAAPSRRSPYPTTTLKQIHREVVVSCYTPPPPLPPCSP